MTCACEVFDGLGFPVVPVCAEVAGVNIAVDATEEHV